MHFFCTACHKYMDYLAIDIDCKFFLRYHHFDEQFNISQYFTFLSADCASESVFTRSSCPSVCSFVCVSVCLSPKCKRKRDFLEQNLSNLELCSLLTICRKSYRSIFTFPSYFFHHTALSDAETFPYAKSP